MRRLFATCLCLLGVAALYPTDVSAASFQPHQSCAGLLRVSSGQVRYGTDLQTISDRFGDQMVALHDLRLFGEDMSGLELANLCFVGADFEKTIWSAGKGKNLVFEDSNLNQSRWKDYQGEELTFRGSQLKYANFSNGQFLRTKFAFTTIEGLNARNADLSFGSFEGHWSSYITDARFDFANLTGFDIHCGNTTSDYCGQYSENVSFRGANLTAAVLDMTSISGRDFTGATIASTSMPLYLAAEMRRARIVGPVRIIRAGWGAISHRSIEQQLSISEFKYLQDNLNELHVWESQPSFDCDSARTSAEEFICKLGYGRNPQLAIEDSELARAYDAALRNDPSIWREQLMWLGRRDDCIEASSIEYEQLNCFRVRYEERTEQLWDSAKSELNLKSGEKLLFANAPEYFDDAFLESELYRRLAPAIVGNSWNYVVLEAMPNGRLSAYGYAVGSNGHLGGLHSPQKGLVYHEESGCYVAKEHNEADETDPWIFPIVRVRGNALGVEPECSGIPAPEYNDWIMLGARAGFSRMRKVPLSTSQIEHLLGAEMIH